MKTEDGNLLQHIATRTESVEDGLVLALFCRCALSAQVGMGAGRNQMGQHHFWES